MVCLASRQANSQAVMLPSLMLGLKTREGEEQPLLPIELGCVGTATRSIVLTAVARASKASQLAGWLKSAASPDLSLKAMHFGNKTE